MKTEDYYINDHGKRVFTETYHLRRGFCCSSGCKHCPYEPKHTKGATNVAIRERDRSENSSTETTERSEDFI